MKLLIHKNKLIASLLALNIIFTSALQADFSNGQNADLVLGQNNFTDNTGALGQDRFQYPYGAVINPISGKLYVSDGDNNRVLRFSSVLSNGMNAEGVLGHIDFLSNADGRTASNFDFSSDPEIDSQGNLWVSDYNNRRVLRFNSVDSKANGAAADLVIGQTDFTSIDFTASASVMGIAEGIHIDKNGRLWIADGLNNRVLWFDDAANLINGASASGVLGQGNFTNNSSGTSQTTFSFPTGVFVDEQDNLWVTECHNNRVLKFSNASSLTNGAAADTVFGHSDFDTNTEGVSESDLDCPFRAVVDNAGTLWVSEYSNNRVIGYIDAANRSSGAAADYVLGQPDFTTKDCLAAENKLCLPIDVSADLEGNLLVTDYGNSRVVRYSPSSTQPDLRVSFSGKTKGANIINATGVKQKLPISMETGSKALRFSFKVKNTDTTSKGFYRISGPRYNKKSFRVKYYYKGRNVTAQVVAGTFIMTALEAGKTEKLTVRVATAADNSLLNKKIKLTATSAYDNSQTDVSVARITR